MSKNIFITGCNGLIGSSLVKILCNEGHTVVGFDNFCGSYRESLVEYPNFIFYKHDCCDLDFLTEVCEKHKIDTIFHCACIPHEGYSVVSPILISESIYRPTTTVGVVAARCDIQRVYNFSSMARYGEGSDRPFSEEDKPCPIDPYGASKYGAEIMLNTMSDLYGFEIIHLIPHNVFGSISGRWDDPTRGVLNIFINSALRKEPLLVHGDGEQKRSFSFADDVFSFVPDILDADIENKMILNIGPDSPDTFISINDLAKMVQEELGDTGIIYGRPRHKEAKLAWCSSDKVRRLFGWESNKTVRQGVKEVCKYIVSRGPKDWNKNMCVEIPKHVVESW